MTKTRNLINLLLKSCICHFFCVILSSVCCVHMNAREGMRTLDAKRGSIESQKNRAAGRRGNGENGENGENGANGVNGASPLSVASPFINQQYSCHH